jgi:predicted RND superfamily exporter protein
MTIVHKKFEAWYAKLAAQVYQKKYVALICMLLLTLALAGQVVKLTIDTRDESFFHTDDPTLTYYNKFRDTFGQDDTFIIALKPRDGFTIEFFETLSRLHRDLEKSIPYLDDITSLVNGRILRAEGDTLFVEKLMETPPTSRKALGRLLKQIDRYPLYEKLLVSPDRTITSILIKAQAIKPVSDENLLEGFDQDISGSGGSVYTYLSNAENVEITAAIHEVVNRYQNQGIDFYFAGTPAFVAEFQNAIEKDLGKVIPLSLAMIILFLFILFRRLSGVIYPLVIVILSLIASVGMMAVLNIPITLATQILPLFLIVVGIGDSVHILTIFYRNHKVTSDKRGAITEALRFAGLPVLITSLTTACGLFSLVWADVGAISQLGIIAPIGVMVAFLYTVFLLPALIAIFPILPAKKSRSKKRTWSDRLLEAIARLTIQKPVWVVTIAAIVMLSAGFSAISVRFSHNAMTWFPEKALIRNSTELLDEVNGGTVMLEAIIDSGSRNGLHDPTFLKRLDSAVTLLPNLGNQHFKAAKSWAVTDMLKEINRALHQDNNDAYRVPDNREVIAQELILFESSGSDDLEDVTDSTYQTARLSTLTPFADAVQYKDYIEEVETVLKKQFPDAHVVLTGHMVLAVQVIKHFITSLFKSYIFALLIITALMVVMIGRIRIGLLSMVANITPIVMVFGVMGIFSIPLDMSTIMIGSLILGLVVDDTIHFLHHFRRAFENSNSVEDAVSETLATTGRALVITSLVLCGGFLIYVTSNLANNIRFGLLTSCAVVFGLAADFFLVPALLSIVNRRRGVL